MNIDQAIKKASVDLKRYQIKSALLDCEILMSKVLNKSRKFVIMNPNEKIKVQNKHEKPEHPGFPSFHCMGPFSKTTLMSHGPGPCPMGPAHVPWAGPMGHGPGPWDMGWAHGTWAGSMGHGPGP